MINNTPQAPMPRTHAQPMQQITIGLQDIVNLYTHLRQLPDQSTILKETVTNLELELLRFTKSFQSNPNNTLPTTNQQDTHTS